VTVKRNRDIFTIYKDSAHVRIAERSLGILLAYATSNASYIHAFETPTMRHFYLLPPKHILTSHQIIHVVVHHALKETKRAKAYV
jgi:hypothetical protein